VHRGCRISVRNDGACIPAVQIMTFTCHYHIYLLMFRWRLGLSWWRPKTSGSWATWRKNRHLQAPCFISHYPHIAVAGITCSNFELLTYCKIWLGNIRIDESLRTKVWCKVVRPRV